MFKERYDFSKTRIILHAGTPKPTNSLRFYVYETPDEYVQSIRELARVVEFWALEEYGEWSYTMTAALFY